MARKAYVLVLLYEISINVSVLGGLVAKDDNFVGFFNNFYQRMVDDSQRSWDRHSSPNKLELLTNDQFYPESLTTCKIERDRTKIESTNKNITFKEIAKTAGFKHVHRDSVPARPHCQFDYVILGNGNVSNSFSNELCVMEMLTGGSAVGDYDNDGNLDIFFTVYNGRSLLYRNNGDGTFTDVTVSANVGPQRFGNGAGWIDVDSDGDLDLYVTTVGDSRHYLYINYGGHFKEEAFERGVALQFENRRKLAGFTPNFGDFNQDGYLDIYVSEWMYHSTSGKVSASRLFKNLGSTKPGYFADVTDSAGVNMDSMWLHFRNKHGSGTHVFGSSFTDFDNDGWVDLLVSADFGQSKLFWNNRNGTFTSCEKNCAGAGKDAMGHTIGDLNNDEYLDAFITAVHVSDTSCRLFTCAVGPMGNGLFQNNQNRSFSDITDQVNVRDGHWGWGASFIDFDNDGYLDITSTNGFDGPSTTLDDEYGKDNMQLFHNKGEGHNNKMVDVAVERGMKFYGLGRGLLVWDYDQDGDEDVLVAAHVGAPMMFENQGGNSNNFLRITVYHRCLENTKRLCDSYGARVQVTSKSGKVQTSHIGSKTHFLGQSELTAHFGLGSTDNTANVYVYWPRTKKSVTIHNTAANQHLKVVEPSDVQQLTLTDPDLNACPSIKIKEITKQPENGRVEINSDRQSVSFTPGEQSLFGIGIQHFQYSVETSPHISNATFKATVSLDFRVNLPDEFYPKCTNGRADIKVNEHMEPTKKRRLDGFSNNADNVHWGSTVEDLKRLAPPSYADNISEPAGACSGHQKVTNTCPYPDELSGIGSNRPSARLISNVLMSQTQDRLSRRNLSDFIMHYGQFLAHDTDHSSPLPRYEFQFHTNHVWMPITIPKGDSHFDPYSTGKETMSFIRSAFNRCTGHYPGKPARQQFNQLSAYIDANNVYGNSLQRCNHLREHKNGRLRIGDNMLLPKNTAYLANENPTGRPGQELYLAGDVRANVQPGLMAIHALFVREHNRLAHEYKLKHPLATDEETFQKARRLLIAEIQSITYNEYLPAILGGSSHIPKYSGYKKNMDVGITNEFATAAFRFGHSQVNSHIFRLQKDNTPIKEGHALLREMYFKPNRLENEGGVDPVFRGAIYFPAQEIDLKMVDEMRNTLFPTSAAAPGKSTGFDLASLNIQRGRDHGLPDLNTVRMSIGLKKYTSFHEITKEKELANQLENLYKDINNIDLWVGGLAEDHVKNSELGETFHAIIVEQFTRLRDGDRFWYQVNLTKEEIQMVENVTMGEIIKLNTGFDDCPDNVFFAKKNCIGVKNHQCIPRLQSNEAYELKLQNEKLEREKRESDDKIMVLVIVLCLLCAIFALSTGIIIKVCTKRQTTGTVLDPPKYNHNPKKPVVDLGIYNSSVET